MEAGAVAQPGVDEIDYSFRARNTLDEAGNEELLQELRGCIALSGVEIFGVVEGRENGIFHLFSELGKFAHLATDNGDAARFPWVCSLGLEYRDK